MRLLQLALLLFVAAVSVHSALTGQLPHEYHNDLGPFSMAWGFSADEVTIEFTLRSDSWIGLGLGCTSSENCDMIVGNSDGGLGYKPFLLDTWEAHGARASVEDTLLGGTNDVHFISSSYNSDYTTTLRISRKLDTGDKFDHPVMPNRVLDIVYAWCEPPFCSNIDTAHAPGDWNMVSVNMTASVLHADCAPGSEDLCSCSTLIKRGAITSFDECTQEAAITYCKTHGACY